MGVYVVKEAEERHILRSLVPLEVRVLKVARRDQGQTRTLNMACGSTVPGMSHTILLFWLIQV